MSRSRPHIFMQAAGACLVALAIASLLALSVAQAHCLQIQVLVQSAVDHHVHGAHRYHHADDPTTPRHGQTDDCCGVLCTTASHLVGPQHAAVPALGLDYAVAPTRLVHAVVRTAKRPLLPVGSRAPPVLA